MRKLRVFVGAIIALIVAVSSMLAMSVFSITGEAAYSKEYLVSDGTKFIKYVALTYSGSQGNAKDYISSCTDAYLDFDLNDEAGGDYVYMGWKTTTNPQEAITGMRIVRYTKDEKPDTLSPITSDGVTWYPANSGIHSSVPKLHEDGCVDLNEDAGGRYLYLYVTTDKSFGDPISDLQARRDANSSASYKYVSSFDATSEICDVNDGQSDLPIYLFYMSKTLSYNSSDLRSCVAKAKGILDNDPIYNISSNLESRYNTCRAYVNDLDSKGYISTSDESPADVNSTVSTAITDLKNAINSCWQVIFLDAATNGGSCKYESFDVSMSDTKTPDLSWYPATKSGYTFLGWSKDANAKSGQLSGTMTVSAGDTLYAIFKKDITVTYVYDNGQENTTETYSLYNNAKLIYFYLPSAPTKEGYRFNAWKIWSSLSAPGTRISISGSCTITATWFINKYTVRFLDSAGEVIDSQTVEYGKSATAPAYSSITSDADTHTVAAGWDRGFDNITGDTDITATYITEAHKDFSVLTDDATCTENGTSRKLCGVCDKLITEIIPATGHTYETTDGIYKCKDCDLVFSGKSEDGTEYVDGVILVNGWSADGKSYYRDGVRLEGDHVAGNGRYNFTEDGPVLIETNGIYRDVDGKLYLLTEGYINFGLGLTEIDGEYYYVRSAGVLVQGGTWYVDKDNSLGVPAGIYTFDADGKMVKPSGIVETNGNLYYYIDGAPQRGLGLIEIDGEYYYVRSAGVLVRDAAWYVDDNEFGLPAGAYSFGADGKMVKQSGIIEKDGVLRYYIDGIPQRGLGLVEIDGNYYYVRSSGVVVTNGNWYVDKNNAYGIHYGTYFFDETGKMVF